MDGHQQIIDVQIVRISPLLFQHNADPEGGAGLADTLLKVGSVFKCSADA